MRISLISFISIFTYILPPALLLGSFFPDLIISINTLLFIFISLKKKLTKYYDNIFTKIFFIFYFYILLRSLLSDHVLLSLESSLFYFRFGIFSLSVWYLIDNNRKFLTYFRVSLLITVFACIFDGYYQFYFRENIFGLSSDSNYRLISFGGQLTLGNTLVRLMPLVLALIVIKTPYKFTDYIIFLILLVLTDILIYLSGERTAFLLLMISTIYVIFLIKKFKFIRIFTFIFSLLIILLITFFNEPVKNRMIDVTLNQMGYDQQSSNKVIIFTKTHTSHYISAYRMFLDNPIFGHGPKTFREKCKENKYNYNVHSCSTHPHNIYLQILSETGIIGASYLLIPFILLVYYSIFRLKNILLNTKDNLSDFEICLLACMLITLWPIAPSLSFFNNWNSIIIYLPVGFLLSSIYKKRIEVNEK